MKWTLIVIIIIIESDLHPLKVQEEVRKLLGREDVRIHSHNNFLIIFFNSEAGKGKIMGMSSLVGSPVKAFLPDKKSAFKQEHCITGVPSSLTDDEIAKCLNCISAARMQKRIKGNIIAISVVKMMFKEQPPERVKIGYLSFKVKPYIREPLMCFKCCGSGHIAANCKGEQKCPICTGKHSIKECNNKTIKICASCGGTDHHTGQATCPKRRQERQFNALRASEKMSYADAVKKLKSASVSINDKGEVPIKALPDPPATEQTQSPKDQENLKKTTKKKKKQNKS